MVRFNLITFENLGSSDGLLAVRRDERLADAADGSYQRRFWFWFWRGDLHLLLTSYRRFLRQIGRILWSRVRIAVRDSRPVHVVQADSLPSRSSEQLHRN